MGQIKIFLEAVMRQKMREAGIKPVGAGFKPAPALGAEDLLKDFKR